MSDLRGRFQVTSPDIVHEDFDGECVILDLASGKYFALSKTASSLVAQLLSGVALEELATLAGPAYSSEDTRQFFTRLVELELIASTPEIPASSVTGTLRESAKTWPDRPMVEVYDDLADLIIADPIHDTDATVGWPAIMKAA